VKLEKDTHLLMKLKEILDFCESFCVNNPMELRSSDEEDFEIIEERKEHKKQHIALHEAHMGLFKQDDGGEVYKPLFRDFEVLETIGGGSFGRVFKVRHKDSGLIMAMKAMKKQYLV
jgi:hypothetical protein